MSDTEKAALERRIDELCAELGRTQLNCDMWHDRAETMRKRLSAAQDENAKLRELLDYMTPIAWYAASERERDRMRELGIEVRHGC